SPQRTAGPKPCGPSLRTRRTAGSSAARAVTASGVASELPSSTTTSSYGTPSVRSRVLSASRVGPMFAASLRAGMTTDSFTAVRLDEPRRDCKTKVLRGSGRHCPCAPVCDRQAPDMRVLVTGGAGFIGSFVVDRLLAAGHTVRVLDNLDPQVHPQGAPAYLAAQAELVRGDVRDRGLLERSVADADAVVHAAAAVGIGQSLYRVEHYVDVNVRGTATPLHCPHPPPRPSRRGAPLGSPSRRGCGGGVCRRPPGGLLRRVETPTGADIARHGGEPVCPETGEPLEPAPTPEDSALLARNVYALTKRWQ